MTVVSSSEKDMQMVMVVLVC